MPRALQAKLARETDKKAVLCTSFDPPSKSAFRLTHLDFVLFFPARALEKWLQMYRTKVALRAVA